MFLLRIHISKSFGQDNTCSVLKDCPLIQRYVRLETLLKDRSIHDGAIVKDWQQYTCMTLSA